jgi:hypothetical protein
MPVKLLNVPVFVPIGWIFTFYLAYEFVNKLIEPKTVKDYKNFITFAAFFSICICVPIETAALNMNWWWVSFTLDGNIAPFYLMGGWCYTSALFFCIYFVVKKKLPIEQLWFVVFLLIAVFNVETNLRVWVLIIVFLAMLKYNKEITSLLGIYMILYLSRRTTVFLFIPNAILVTIIFIFIFIFVYIFVKLRFMDAKRQLSIEESH